MKLTTRSASPALARPKASLAPDSHVYVSLEHATPPPTTTTKVPSESQLSAGGLATGRRPQRASRLPRTRCGEVMAVEGARAVAGLAAGPSSCLFLVWHLTPGFKNASFGFKQAFLNEGFQHGFKNAW